MNDFLGAIPNIFYDLICRIVPGALLLYFYCPAFRKEHADGRVPIALFAKLFLAAWIVGMTLDVVTAQARHILPMIGLKTANSLPEAAGLEYESYSRKLIKALVLPTPEKSVFLLNPSEWWRSILRAMADRAMFRMMFAITLILLVWPPKDPPSSLARLKSRSWLHVAAAAVFLICFLGRGYEAGIEIEQANKEWATQSTIQSSAEVGK